jgi:hypothetical protein
MLWAETLEVFAIDDETGFVCDLVVKLHGRFVGLVSEPVDAAGTGVLGAAINFLDERALRPCHERTRA